MKKKKQKYKTKKKIYSKHKLIKIIKKRYLLRFSLIISYKDNRPAIEFCTHLILFIHL